MKKHKQIQVDLKFKLWLQMEEIRLTLAWYQIMSKMNAQVRTGIIQNLLDYLLTCR